MNPSRLAVILDMDGLMLDSERLSMAAWKSAAAANNLDLPDALYRGMIGLNGPDCRTYLQTHRLTDADVDLLQGAAQKAYLLSVDLDGAPPKPGLFELLDYLDAHAIPRAVATSTQTEMASHKLERAGVLKRLPIIVGGEQVARGKPAPDIYLLAAQRLGVPAGQCVALEDSPNGVRAAHAAGMAVILVPDIAPIDDAIKGLAAAVVSSLSEAIQILQGL